MWTRSLSGRQVKVVLERLGDADLGVCEQLDAQLSGSGDLSYAGGRSCAKASAARVRSGGADAVGPNGPMDDAQLWWQTLAGGPLLLALFDDEDRLLQANAAYRAAWGLSGTGAPWQAQAEAALAAGCGPLWEREELPGAAAERGRLHPCLSSPGATGAGCGGWSSAPSPAGWPARAWT
jgi:hypothetical protein